MPASAGCQIATKRGVFLAEANMSKCPRSDCNGMSFTMRELKVSNSNFRLNSIECSLCGAVVAVLEFTNISAMLHKLGKKLGVSLP